MLTSHLTTVSYTHLDVYKRQVLKEEFSVTDEEITQAMEELGLGFLDLRNMQNLTNLIQTLTGEDIGLSLIHI